MNENPISPSYLGDGVYVEDTGHALILRVNDHRNAPAVVLEPEVMEELIKYYERAKL